MSKKDSERETTKRDEDWTGRKACTSPSCDECEKEDGIEKFGRFGRAFRPWATIILIGVGIGIIIWLIFFGGWQMFADYFAQFIPEFPDIPDIPTELPTDL